MLPRRPKPLLSTFGVGPSGQPQEDPRSLQAQQDIIDEYIYVGKRAREMLRPWASAPYQGLFEKYFNDVIGVHEGVGILLMAAQLDHEYLFDSRRNANATKATSTTKVVSPMRTATEDEKLQAGGEARQKQNEETMLKKQDDYDSGLPLSDGMLKFPTQKSLHFRQQDDIHYQAAGLTENLLGFISTQLVICTLALAVSIPLFVHGVNGVFDPDSIALNGKITDETVIVKGLADGGQSNSSDRSGEDDTPTSTTSTSSSSSWFEWQSSSPGFLFACHIVEVVFLTLSMWNSTRGVLHGFTLYGGVAVYFPELHQKYKFLLSVITQPGVLFLNAANSVFFMCCALPFLCTRISPILTIGALVFMLSIFYTIIAHVLATGDMIARQMHERAQQICKVYCTDEDREDVGGGGDRIRNEEDDSSTNLVMVQDGHGRRAVSKAKDGGRRVYTSSGGGAETRQKHVEEESGIISKYARKVSIFFS
ncbi:unnamed protein product [Amoebophrya sp. A25]|nr:unnamed protein product [Amoebophrya sp. A25]|eukprot:GSA25T00024922001.1